MQFHFLTEMKQMFLLRQRQKDCNQNNKSKQINTNNKKIHPLRTSEKTQLILYKNNVAAFHLQRAC